MHEDNQTVSRGLRQAVILSIVCGVIALSMLAVASAALPADRPLDVDTGPLVSDEVEQQGLAVEQADEGA